MKDNEELRWKREDGGWVFGGAPFGRTGREDGLLLRLNLLDDFKIGKMVLSVGCGTAVELKPFRKRGSVTIGIDPEREFLFEGKAGHNADSFIRAIGESIPLNDSSFDLALLFEVLEHAMQPEAVLEEILRILKPHGLLFITVPNRFYLFETHGFQIRGRQIGNLLGIGIPLFSMAPHFLRRRFERARIYSEAEALSMLRKCCFEPLVMKYLMPSLDMFRKTALTKAISRVFHSLEKMPIFEKLGSSIMIVSEKPEQHRRDLICGLRR